MVSTMCCIGGNSFPMDPIIKVFIFPCIPYDGDKVAISFSM